MFSLRLSLLRLGGKTYGGCFPDASQMLPRCFPDASQMLPRCLSDASHMPPRCLPLHDSFSMISPPVIPPPWLLVMDFSCMIFQVCLQRNSVWGLALGSFNYIFYFGPPGTHLYSSPQNHLHVTRYVVGVLDFSIDSFLEVQRANKLNIVSTGLYCLWVSFMF